MEGFIGIHSDGWNFIDKSTGDFLIPFGANYFDPETGWAPKLWRNFNKDRVTDHFQKMADVGCNVARVFTTTASFQPKADSIPEDGLEKLDTMIDIAKQTGIRLILTGPDHWEGVPDYWKPDKYAGEPALNALEFFWRKVALRYKDEKAIMAWDLLNEPQIPWQSDIMLKKWRAWLQEKYKDNNSLVEKWGSSYNGETLETASIPENFLNAGDQRLYDYQIFRESIAWEWTKRQVEAIQSVDTNHMVTIGFIQWSFPLVRAPWGEKANQPGWYSAFSPIKLAPLLDFMCIHFYPILGDPGDRKMALLNTRYLQSTVNYCYVGKPVVIEEYGWHGGGEMDGKYRTEAYQSAWNTNVVNSTLELASGWVVWAFSDTPTSTDITKYGGLYNIKGKLKEWGKDFKLLSEKLTSGSALKRLDKVRNAKIDERQAFTADPRQLYSQYVLDSGISELTPELE